MPQAIFAYHLGMDAEQYAFFRIPKLLITEPYFRRLSTDAKLLYGLMLDRMSLSMRNGWMDDDGHVYIYFTLEEACEQLCCKTDKAAVRGAGQRQRRGPHKAGQAGAGQTGENLCSPLHGYRGRTRRGYTESGASELPKSRLRKNRSQEF